MKCVLCKSTKNDKLKYGEFHIYKTIEVHYFCLLLTSNLCQKGDDNEGILGFLPKDIIQEAKRVESQICIYCNKSSANIGCCHPKCRRTFHFICGLKNGAQNQFFNTYRSFCHQHVFKSMRKFPPHNETCGICYETFKYPNIYTMALCTPCCKNGWFHKWCLQKLAVKAGYFFKCPLCNNEEIFCKQLSHLGIFIPEKDADWELETNYFEDMLVRPNECSAVTCFSNSGREFSDYKEFTFIFCHLCGSQVIHKICKEKTKKNDLPFKCFECEDILPDSKSDILARNTNINEKESQFVNIENSDESEDDIMDTNFQRNALPSTGHKNPEKSEGVHLKKLVHPRFNQCTISPTIEKKIKRSFEKFETDYKNRFANLDTPSTSTEDKRDEINFNTKISSTVHSNLQSEKDQCSSHFSSNNVPNNVIKQIPNSLKLLTDSRKGDKKGVEIYLDSSSDSCDEIPLKKFGWTKQKTWFGQNVCSNLTNLKIKKINPVKDNVQINKIDRSMKKRVISKTRILDSSDSENCNTKCEDLENKVESSSQCSNSENLDNKSNTRKRRRSKSINLKESKSKFSKPSGDDSIFPSSSKYNNNLRVLQKNIKYKLTPINRKKPSVPEKR